MRSSASSSATGNSPSPRATFDAPPRKAFALTGRSRPLDPRTNAVRPDIADIRLAEYVFAPHYVAALARRVKTAAGLRADRTADSEMLAALSPGDTFELLDIIGGIAWGVATSHGLVGYVAADALDPVD